MPTVGELKTVPGTLKNPKLPASIELKELVSMMKMTDKETFEGGLKLWHTKC